jgi:hypothetical protein
MRQLRTVFMGAAMAIAAGMFFGTSDAEAEVVSADMLRAACSWKSLPADFQPVAKNMCNTTIRAYLEYNASMKTHFGLTVPFCLAPGGSSLAGASAAFTGFLANNPAMRSEPAAIVFPLAMQSVSRC